MKIKKMKTFAILNRGTAIRCNICGLTSFNPNDVKKKYCGRCGKFHDDLAAEQFAKYKENIDHVLQIHSDDGNGKESKEGGGSGQS